MTALEEILQKIKAKITLGLPLTEREAAMWTLYGERNDIRKSV